jgi:flagellar biosynthesis/type III secretory pathway chaperone
VSPSPTPSPHALLELEIAGYKALLRLLDAECDALRRVDLDGIESTAEAKATQVRALEQLARLREAALESRGLPATAAGIALWLSDGDVSVAAPTAWTILLDLARATRTANARNGRLVDRQRRHYDAAFGALSHAAGRPAVYGADGRPQTATLGRTLAAI